MLYSPQERAETNTIFPTQTSPGGIKGMMTEPQNEQSTAALEVDVDKLFESMFDRYVESLTGSDEKLVEMQRANLEQFVQGSFISGNLTLISPDSLPRGERVTFQSLCDAYIEEGINAAITRRHEVLKTQGAQQPQHIRVHDGDVDPSMTEKFSHAVAVIKGIGASALQPLLRRHTTVSGPIQVKVTS